nr:uncharacterized protein LOC108132580 isoform X1 [Drosophila bipectinata]
MRVLGIILMFGAISISDSQYMCKKTIPGIRDPHCGLGNKCHFNGLNQHAIGFEACRRRVLGLPEFLKVVRGLCPKGDKPPCPRLSKRPPRGKR